MDDREIPLGPVANFKYLADFQPKASCRNTRSAYSYARNGANMSALFLLALYYNERHEEQKAIGGFSNYVMARAQTTKTRLLAIIKAQDEQGYQSEALKCANVPKLQEALIQQMQDTMYRQ